MIKSKKEPLRPSRNDSAERNVRDMSKIWRKIWTLSLMLLLFALPVRADAGPKPSVVITLEGAEGIECWGTLITHQKSTGPYSASETLELSGDITPGERSAWEQFQVRWPGNGAGPYFLCYVDSCSDGQFNWTYYPPSEFQLALWFPDTQTVLVSQDEGRYAFDSYFTLSLEGVELTAGEQGGLLLDRSYDYMGEVLGLLGRVALTVGLEMLAALAFGLREKRQMAVILAANLATQGLLNLGLNLFTYFCGALAGMTVIFMVPVYLLAELLVTAVELKLYHRLLAGRAGLSRGRVTAYTWAANVLSFLAGLALSFQIPGLF